MIRSTDIREQLYMNKRSKTNKRYRYHISAKNLKTMSNDYRIIGLFYLNSQFRTLYKRFFRTSSVYLYLNRARDKSHSLMYKIFNSFILNMTLIAHILPQQYIESKFTLAKFEFFWDYVSTDANIVIVINFGWKT
jgi:hypothetical protein